MKAIYYTLLIIISILCSFAIKYYLVDRKNKFLNNLHYIITSGWLIWTLGGSSLVVGYSLRGELLQTQILLIIVTFIIGFILFRFVIRKDSQIQKAKEDAKKLNNSNFNWALEKLATSKDLNSKFSAIDGLNEHRKILFLKICI